jgi:outer membrane protein OmpA-like peptidoglycan-associated protein
MNLLNVFKDLAGDQLANLAGDLVGASKQETAIAMDSVLPALMGGLLGKVSDEKSAGGFMDFLGNNDLNGGLLDNIGDLFGSPEKSSGLMGMGGTILNFLMGNKTNAVIDLLTRVTGMDNAKMGSLLKIAAPFLMSFIGKKVKSENMGAGGLLGLLNSQRDYVKEAAPAGLLGSLGLSGWGDSISGVANKLGDSAGRATDQVTHAAGEVANAGKSGIQKLLPWLVLLLGALGLFYILRGCNAEEMKDAANSAMDKTEEMASKTGDAMSDAANATTDAVKDAADATGEALENAGDAVVAAFKSFKLPDGSEIKYKTGSFVDKVSAYLSGSEVDAKQRFTFDGVNFKTGSAQLTEESADQLNNLVALMKAYKSMAIAIEGHTDNSGDAASNLKLSDQRALAVKKYLMDNGIAGARVAAKGMGQTQPIADNNTEEGKATNRRVDVYVTKK